MAAEPAVLVTRPAGAAADALCAALAAAGFRPYRQPLLELQSLSPLAPRQRAMVLELDCYQHVIFISGNAVHFGMSVLEDYWPQLPVGLRWYAVGDATARALGAHGIAALTPGSDMTSEGLLALPSLAAVSGQRVLVVKGEGGRDTLARELAARGARVDELACYRRLCPVLEPGALGENLRRWQIRAILVSSGEGLVNLGVLLRPQEPTKFRKLCLVVPSARVAEMAREAGFDQVVTAHNASDAAMLNALQEWNNSPGDNQ